MSSIYDRTASQVAPAGDPRWKDASIVQAGYDPASLEIRYGYYVLDVAHAVEEDLSKYSAVLHGAPAYEGVKLEHRDVRGLTGTFSLGFAYNNEWLPVGVELVAGLLLKATISIKHRKVHSKTFELSVPVSTLSYNLVQAMGSVLQGSV